MTEPSLSAVRRQTQAWKAEINLRLSQIRAGLADGSFVCRDSFPQTAAIVARIVPENIEPSPELTAAMANYQPDPFPDLGSFQPLIQEAQQQLEATSSEVLRPVYSSFISWALGREAKLQQLGAAGVVEADFLREQIVRRLTQLHPYIGGSLPAMCEAARAAKWTISAKETTRLGFRQT